MSVNDREIGAAKGSDIYPGVANPTSHSTQADPYMTNFVTDPTSGELGAGVGNRFRGHEQAARNFKQTAGVVEGRPGIIETTNIDPLNENSNKDDGWANASRTAGGGTEDATAFASSLASSAAGMASGAAKYAYGLATGDEESRQQGSETLFGRE
ncbi:hypothetical protein K488DRAFT_78526 [Vararia minispora EC-137]|uniref:Uncharacterized protein n=1 Tax=Vararia minispora EC-137 TaxID=1314806 RepID=A0ACB8QKU4_9AGAM|nr:hypothetical protein K488DRAFT_78526 [Vararia minispora EC-137]